MAKFKCASCGKCCISLGQYIKIERKLTDRDYYCRLGINNEIFLAHVQADYFDDFSDQSEHEANPDHCVFLRKDRNGKGFVCTIYPTRPSLCRDFKCYRMLILAHKRTEIGRLMGRNEIRTSDEVLNKLWQDRVLNLPHNDDTAWLHAVQRILSDAGYMSELCE